MRRIVVKFGGMSVGDGERVRLAARSVVRERERGAQVAVVVSAMGHATDELLEAARSSTGGKISPAELDDILAMGERTSARIFASALRSLGADARCIDPAHEEWPVVTDSSFGNARVDLPETRRRVRRFILPLLEEGAVPVICGFLGKDAEGRITTLGRGGSDITAFLIGACLDADEVILVKDVEGVMSGDPSAVKGARLLESISVEEMRDLARYGARVLHPRALDYKDPKINAKVIHFRHGDLSARGTVITGPRGGSMGVSLYEKPLAMLTVVGEEMQSTPGVLRRAVEPLSKQNINIFGVSIGPRSFSLYVNKREAKRAIELLHRVVVKNKVMKSVTSEEDIAMIIAESEKFIETPGVIAKLTEPLAKEGINIIEIFSSRASITFFVNWADGERAVKLLEQAMREVGS
ncbi:MAG: aspartate kinase [Candidatus Hadarchaeales archaeon]